LFLLRSVGKVEEVAMKTSHLIATGAVVFVISAAVLALAHGPGATRWGGAGPAGYGMMGHHSMMGQGPGMMGGPMMGQGPGMTGGPMMGMGYGMMGMGPGPGADRGGGRNAWMPMWGPEPSRPLSTDEVRRMVDGRLAWRRNDRLKLGKVEERDANTVVVEIVTLDGSLVDRMGIDRQTGRGRRLP
jgi:hypothetical protein